MVQIPDHDNPGIFLRRNDGVSFHLRVLFQALARKAPLRVVDKKAKAEQTTSRYREKLKWFMFAVCHLESERNTILNLKS
jgi:hypothetical protein